MGHENPPKIYLKINKKHVNIACKFARLSLPLMAAAKSDN